MVPTPTIPTCTYVTIVVWKAKSGGRNAMGVKGLGSCKGGISEELAILLIPAETKEV
jgi:hypothetical protein